MLNINNGQIIVPSECVKFASLYTEVRREKAKPEKFFRILLTIDTPVEVITALEGLFNRNDTVIKIHDKDDNAIQLKPYIVNATLQRMETDIIGEIYRLDFYGDEVRY